MARLGCVRDAGFFSIELYIMPLCNSPKLSLVYF
jgi:hypothetical protein